VFRESLQRSLAGIAELTVSQSQELERHYELLLRWNRVLNLTAILNEQEALERHYCESIFLARHLREEPLKIVDIGSGGGFPGFPVAVMRPDCHVTLVESHRRKAVFLREATRHMAGVRVLSMRAEDVMEQFDCVISRAVSYEALAPVLKKLGRTAELLTGAEEPPDSLCFTWNKVPLPWGQRRYLRFGVPRETQEC
jgi:16S rRNA (guanine527-N7)-methyltransferase